MKWLAVLGGLAACAPMTTTTRFDERVLTRSTRMDAPKATATEILVDAGADALSVRLLEKDTCNAHNTEDFRRTRRVHRSVNKPIVVLEYILGIGLGGGGGFAAWQPNRTTEYTTDTTGFDSEQTRYAGAAVAGLGAIFLVAAIANSTRGGDSATELPVEHRDVGVAFDRACGERAVSGRELAIAAGAHRMKLPATDASGRTRLAWEAMTELLEGAEFVAAASITDEQGTRIAVDLASVRARLAERAWEVATSVGTARAAWAYRKRFPDVHVAEVAARIADKGDVELDAEVAAAIAGDDSTKATELIAEWATLVPASDRRTARQAELDAKVREARIASVVKEIDAALAQTDDPDLVAFGSAVARVTELATLAPDDARTIERRKRIDELRGKRQLELVARAQAAFKANDLDAALALIDRARDLQPSDAPTTRARDELRKQVARRHADVAQAKIRAKDFAAAAEALSRAEAILPGDRVVVATRRQLVASQTAAEAAIADANERARRKAEREKRDAELREAREGERKAAEAAKEAARVAAKEKADAEAARRAEEHARKKQEDEARKLDAAARAKAQKEADELARADAARKKADEEAKRKADEEASKKKKVDAVAAAEAARKAAEDAKRVTTAKQPTVEQPRVTPPVTPTVVAARTPAANIVGLWVASARTARGPVTLVFDATARGTGQIAMLDANGRLLGRQPVSWRFDRELVIDGGRQFGTGGRGKLRGASLVWAGLTWRKSS